MPEVLRVICLDSRGYLRYDVIGMQWPSQRHEYVHYRQRRPFGLSLAEGGERGYARRLF